LGISLGIGDFGVTDGARLLIFKNKTKNKNGSVGSDQVPPHGSSRPGVERQHDEKAPARF
jgi:hypothetical protein